MFVLLLCSFVFFFKQKTAYEMRISDWSSDVCSSDLRFPWVRRLVNCLHIRSRKASLSPCSEGSFVSIPNVYRRARNQGVRVWIRRIPLVPWLSTFRPHGPGRGEPIPSDRKTTRLNSSH